MTDFRLFLNENRIKVTALTCAFVALLSVIGIQGVPFWDDSLRRLVGITDWGSWDGRWGSELVGRSLNAGRSVVDLGLTTFIISGLIMAVAAAIVVWVLVGRRANWLTWVLALALGLNPWILNALAFRFDGPFMALSVLFAVSTMLFYRSSLPKYFIACAVLTLVTANFFQSAIGLILTLLMTRALLDWLRGDGSPAETKETLQRIGTGFAGVGIGVVLYAIQARILGTGRADWFDLSNPFGSFARNLFHFIRVFILDNATSWLVVTGLVAVLALVTLWLLSCRSPLRTMIVVPIYIILSVIASGGVLLFATAEHVSVQARFRFPLAMGVGMLAIIASVDWSGETPRFSRAWRISSKVVLSVFAYLWLMTVFLFANTLTEQNEALRFQSRIMFADVFSLYRAGDVIVYDPNVFTNSRYSDQVGQRFPIFNNSTYVGRINLHSDTVRDRMNEMLGLGQGILFATNDVPEACDFREPDTDILTGPRWEAWRSDDNIVCLTFPAVSQIEVNTPEQQIVVLDMNRFPFGAGISPVISDLNPEQLQVAVWSLTNPSDIQWFNPETIVHGMATFRVASPAAGWQGDLIVAHYFLDDEFLFQQIWQLADE